MDCNTVLSKKQLSQIIPELDVRFNVSEHNLFFVGTREFGRDDEFNWYVDGKTYFFVIKDIFS